MKCIDFLNRQKTSPVKIGQLRRITQSILQELKVGQYEIGVHLVDSAEMAGINEKYLNHAGSTDVITFDHGSTRESVHGEIFVCVPVARTQAPRFHASWQSEIARYICHGILHLAGYDDLNPPARRAMKRQENAIMRQIEREFDLSALGYG